MTKRMKAKRNAFSSTQEVIALYATVWAGYLPFEVANAAFNADVAAIDDADEIQSKLIKGFTLDKEKKRIGLTDAALSIQGKVANWAIARGETALAGQMRFSRSRILLRSTTAARTAAEIIYDAAIAIPVADQVAFELTPAITASYRATIDSFIAVMASPRTQVAIRSFATKQLPILFRNATDTLELRVSNLMERYRISNPDFYREFENSKIIVDSIRHTTVEGVVVDHESGMPLNKVKVLFTSSEKQFEELTDAEGHYSKSELNPELEWTVKFVIPGFEEKELAVPDLKRGEHDVMNVGLVKV